MKKLPTSAFDHWSSGKRRPSDYIYGVAAYPASLLYRLASLFAPPLSRRFPCLEHSRLIVISSPLVGGVGKTPLTALLANHFKERKLRTAIVTMGYGRATDEDVTLSPDAFEPTMIAACGDEAVELMRLTGLTVHVGGSPESVIAGLNRSQDVDWIIFDDGVSRAWDGERRIVVLSANDLLRPVHYLPYGRWRVSPKFLGAARYLAVTGNPGFLDADAIQQTLARFGYHGPHGLFEYKIEGLASLLPSGIVTMTRPPDGRPFAFCGIARPGRFLEAAGSFGAARDSFRAFADHHAYTPADFNGLESERNRHGCTWYLTTLKDAVKIDPGWHGSTPLCFLRIALHQVAGTDIKDVATQDN